jgi:precorrin-2 dehydrogenase/sirohydrochlorin ferrochelatase
MKLLPVALRIEGQRILIVGGGPVAARKARSLLECGAKIKIVAPQLCEELQKEMQQAPSCWEYSQRNFAGDDCDDCMLVFACTNNPQVNAQVAAICKTKNIFCQMADDGTGSTLHGAATIRRDEICIGVSTGGASPALAKHLKEKIENCVGEEYSQLLQLMSERRTNVKTKFKSQVERAGVWRAVLASEVLPLLRDGKTTEAKELVDELIHSEAK